MKRVKKDLMSRILCVCLIFVLTISMTMTVSADDLTADAQDSITVSGIETDDSGNGIGTLYAYRVINVTVNGSQPQAPVYTWADGVAQWIKDHYASYINEEDGNAVTGEFLDLADSGDGIKAFVDELAAAIRTPGSGISVSGIETVSYDLTDYVPEGTDKEIELENVPLGAYLFLVEGGVRIYSPGFASVYPSFEGGKWVTAGQSINVSLKSEEPGIVKDAEDYTFAVGQTVNYTLTVTVPDYPDNAVDKKLIIADYLSEGLTFDGGSLRIYLFDEAADGNKGTEITHQFKDYTFSADGSHPVEGAAPSFAKIFNGDYSALSSKVIAEYSATVNEKAIVKEETDTDNQLDNKAYLIYNNNPYTDTGYREIPDEERVYTYGLKVTKTDNQDTVLPGAEFILKQGDTPLKFIKESSGGYRLPLPTESSDSASEVLVTDSNGLIQIKGLDLGTYTLVETKAPDGYELPADPETEIVLTDDADASGSPDGILNNDSDGTYEISVINTKPGILPVTGGIGTALFTIFGLLLMSGAVILVVLSATRRKNH